MNDTPSGGDVASAEDRLDGDDRIIADVRRSMVLPWMYGVLVFGVFGLFLFSLRAILSPFTLFLLFLFLVWPFVGTRAHVRLIAAGSILFLLWVFETTGLLMAPFVLAMILAYILDPLVDLLERRRVPRTAAIALMALPVIGVIVLVALVVVPAIVHQVALLVEELPHYAAAIEGWLDSARTWIIGLAIPGVTESSVPRIDDLDASTMIHFLEQRRSAVAEGGLRAALGIGRGLGTVIAIVGYMVVLPILTFFLLRDWDRLRAALVELIPPERRPPVLEFLTEYDRLLGRYLRGQLLLALLVGLIIGVGFRIVGFPYALLLGVISGLLNIVPYLGSAFAICAAVLIALLSGNVGVSLLKVAAVLGIERVVEDSVLSPMIVKGSVGLHPVWMILAIALAGFYLGFVGLLIAVPLAVFIKLAAGRAMARYRVSRFYLGAVE